jgi:transposase
MEKRKFSREFKLQVLQELDVGKTPAQVCREHGLKIDLVCRWRREYRDNPEHAFSGRGNPSTTDTKLLSWSERWDSFTWKTSSSRELTLICRTNCQS